MKDFFGLAKLSDNALDLVKTIYPEYNFTPFKTDEF